jgi:hypothetical protein
MSVPATRPLQQRRHRRQRRHDQIRVDVDALLHHLRRDDHHAARTVTRITAQPGDDLIGHTTPVPHPHPRMEAPQLDIVALRPHDQIRGHPLSVRDSVRHHQRRPSDLQRL